MHLIQDIKSKNGSISNFEISSFKKENDNNPNFLTKFKCACVDRNTCSVEKYQDVFGEALPEQEISKCFTRPAKGVITCSATYLVYQGPNYLPNYLQDLFSIAIRLYDSRGIVNSTTHLPRNRTITVDGVQIKRTSSDVSLFRRDEVVFLTSLSTIGNKACVVVTKLTNNKHGAEFIYSITSGN
ncbi:unnamed protein product [Gordionus sp. m RMFG-2023]